MTHIKGFNALRALSITLVVLTHLDLSDWIPNTDFVMKRVWLLISGSLGVQIFFVLSGYLITQILLLEQAKNGKISFKNFFAKRFLRLLPPLLIFFLLIAIANLFDTLTNAKDSIFYAVFYLYNFIPRNVYSLEMGHLWSLGVEEQFYLMWPFLLAFISHHKKLFITLITTIIVLCVWMNCNLASWKLNETYMVGRWFLPAACPIFVGCLGALLPNYYPSAIATLFEKHYFVSILIVTLYLYPLYTPFNWIPSSIFFQSVSVILLLLKIVYNQDKKWVQKLEWRPLAYIGIISYGIYVYQGFFLRTGGGSELTFQQFPINILLTIVLAVVSYELIEKPILKLKKRFK